MSGISGTSGPSGFSGSPDSPPPIPGAYKYLTTFSVGVILAVSV